MAVEDVLVDESGNANDPVIGGPISCKAENGAKKLHK